MYHFARKLDCAFVPEVRSFLVESFGHTENLALFRSASRFDDLELFRAVLRIQFMRELVQTGIWNIVNAIRYDWQVAFLRCCISTTGHIFNPACYQTYDSPDFFLALEGYGSEMAAKFMPEHA